MDDDNRPLPAEVVEGPSDKARSEPIRAEIVGDDSRNKGSWPKFTRIDSSAVFALGLAIASWFVIPIVGALAALFVASGAKRKIKEADGTIEGMSMVTAAKVIAWANLLLFFVAVWLVIWLFKLIF